MQLKYEREVKNEPTKRFQHKEINERFSRKSISLLCNTAYWWWGGSYLGDFLSFF